MAFAFDVGFVVFSGSGFGFGFGFGLEVSGSDVVGVVVFVTFVLRGAMY